MGGESGCDVLVAGEYYCDMIFNGLGEQPRLGAEVFARDFAMMPGGTYNMVLALTRLGVACRWACDFGTDQFSRYVLDQAAGDGIDSSAFQILPQPVPRITAAFSEGTERGFISYSAPAVHAPEADVAARHRPRWLLQTFRFEPDWLAFVAAARQQGAQVFLDCRSPDFTLDTPGVIDLLSLADVFSPNEEEALRLTGAADLAGAVARLRPHCRTVIVKRGPAGALVVTPDGTRQDVPAPQVDVIDTVGAGDCFNAAYLAGRLAGLEAEAVDCAVIGGALSVTGAGGRAAARLDELLATARTLDRSWVARWPRPED